jgi:diguanylate cyclase (GGDEF)-like protein
LLALRGFVNTLLLVLLLPSLPLVLAQTSQQSPAPPQAPLRRLGDVHRLSAAKAAQHLPVDVTGVVTAFSGLADLFFLQDATGALSITREEHATVHVGDRIRAIGRTDAGRFAPVVITEKVQVLGPGRLPRARRFTFQELQGGTEDSHWIEVHGIVRSAKVETVWNRPTLILRTEIGGGPMDIHILDFNPENAAHLVDALITVRGVCGTAFNEKRQFTGVRLFVQTVGSVKVDSAAPPDPFAIPSRLIEDVLRFEPDTTPGHRVKISGVVTLQNPGHSLFVQDGCSGIEVMTDEATPVPLGSSIEAVGFPGLGTVSPTLQEAAIRTLSVGKPPSPIFVGKDGVLRWDNFIYFVPLVDQLIHVEGVVLGSQADARYTWTVQAGGTTMLAVLRRDPSFSSLPLIDRGSNVSLTGVLTADLDSEGQPRYFSVLLRSPADLVVLKRPPWWSARRLLTILGVSIVIMVGILFWSMLLRHRVQQQTMQLRESEERFRRQAQTDALTGLASRSFFHESLQAAIGEAEKTRSGIAVLMLDLDFFKQVNDTLGHQAGDELLRVVAERLRSAVRKDDVVARLGGDEFIVLLRPIDRAAKLDALGAMVVRSVCTEATIAGKTLQISASVGICAYPAQAHDFASLLQNVDAALYRAKASGRNRFVIFDPASWRDEDNMRLLPSTATIPRRQLGEPASSAASSVADHDAQVS